MHAIHYSCTLINALFNLQTSLAFIYTIIASVEHVFFSSSWMVNHQYWWFGLTSHSQAFGKRTRFSIDSVELSHWFCEWQNLHPSLPTSLWPRKWRDRKTLRLLVSGAKHEHSPSSETGGKLKDRTQNSSQPETKKSCDLHKRGHLVDVLLKRLTKESSYTESISTKILRWVHHYYA